MLLLLACRFEEQTVQTAHSDKISGLAFPDQYGEVFATCSLGCIRVWHLKGCRELLRISLPNLECRCITFAPVSYWMSGGKGPVWHIVEPPLMLM
jgi:hypothetical protein